jgi:hypothetical protein
LGWLVLPLALILLLETPASSQTKRTAWGDPDLQGVYTFSTPTPMERPKELGRKATYTDAELASVEEQFKKEYAAEFANEGALTGPPDTGYDRLVWFPGETGKFARRTSLVTYPEDGRIPALTAAAGALRAKLSAQRQADAAARAVSRVVDGKKVDDELYNSWTDLSLGVRCVARSVPRMGGVYNHGVQIIQAPGYVVINYEMNHEARIIPLDSRPTLDPSVRQWNGSSRGHWEGNTLVVKLTNFPEGITFQGLPMNQIEFTERFTKVDDRTVEYAVTVTSPLWTEPWTFILPFRGDDERYQEAEDLYEYACHEGNFRMMQLTLTGSRAINEQVQDKEAK